MPTPLNPDDALRRARELQESRIAIIDDLARSNVELSHARERLTTAESEYGRFHSAALGAGWTGAELSKIGFAEAGKPPRQRRPARRQSAATEDSSSE